mmetsp:Transcript_4644/g.10624  ORF Transcript_4644/g.10624 Transcript_4644/m.10624 type:complete len:222 (+) Transcript_4644:1689-2354(+)
MQTLLRPRTKRRWAVALPPPTDPLERPQPRLNERHPLHHFRLEGVELGSEEVLVEDPVPLQLHQRLLHLRRLVAERVRGGVPLHGLDHLLPEAKQQLDLPRKRGVGPEHVRLGVPSLPENREAALGADHVVSAEALQQLALQHLIHGEAIHCEDFITRPHALPLVGRAARNDVPHSANEDSRIHGDLNVDAEPKRRLHVVRILEQIQRSPIPVRDERADLL